MISEKRLLATEDGQIVEEGDRRGVRLVVGAGGTVPEEYLEKVKVFMSEAPSPVPAATEEANESKAEKKPLRGKLADDFPGKSAFEDAGYDTYAKVRKLHEADELTSVPGVGEATAGAVKEVFEAE